MGDRHAVGVDVQSAPIRPDTPFPGEGVGAVDAQPAEAVNVRAPRWQMLAGRFIADDARTAILAHARGAIGVWVALVAILLVAVAVRLWGLDAVGLNTDEAVYVGQAAALGNDPDLKPYFPVFRAHPLLFQFSLASVFAFTGVSDIVGRIASVAVGVATVFVVYRIGRLLYGTAIGLVAALFFAVMPYHVVVSRQVLLDGPMTLAATLALLAVAKYVDTEEPLWLYGAGAAMGLTFLAKETGVILLAAIYAFFALAPEVAVRLRDLAISFLTLVATAAAFPIALILAGATGSASAQQYLVWQLFRRPNHEIDFYLRVVPPAVGPLVILAAVIGLWLVRRSTTWRERLLLSWIIVVCVFFTLWPVKGFQYLLPAAPALTILAARGVFAAARWGQHGDGGITDGTADRDDDDLEAAGASRRWRSRLSARRAFAQIALTTIVSASLLMATWPRIEASTSSQLLAGSGGIPGGRETGTWILDNTPTGAQIMTIGPSMANVIQFYGHRKALGLSVSPNPLKRNPTYDAIINPDLQIRRNELQYAVWDSFSGSRSPFFEAKLLDYVQRYHGRPVHTESLPSSDGGPSVPIIVVYEVRP